MIRLEAPAKVNLRLRVLGRRADGYHAVETLLLRLDLADTVELERGGAGLRLRVEGPAAAGVPEDEANLGWRAARALFDVIDRPPDVAIRLTKRIPAAAGLGGGSSDAAAVLVGLNELLRTPLAPAELVALGGSLGTDVPFFAAPSAHALAWDRGQRVLPLAPPPTRPVLLLVPDFGVSAAAAYRWWSEDAGAEAADGAPAVLPSAARLAEWEILESLVRNDLGGPVERRHPSLRTAREALERAGAAVAVLCGSGSCVAGIFRAEAERDAARARIMDAGAVPAGWGVLGTSTAGPAG